MDDVAGSGPSDTLESLVAAAGLPAARVLRPIDPDGDGLDNQLTAAELSDGRVVLLRQSRIEAGSPEERIRLLRGNGIPTPVLYAADGAGASLWEYVPGRSLAELVEKEAVTAAVWGNLGAALAQIHAVTFPAPLQGEIGTDSVVLRPVDPVDDLFNSIAGSAAWLEEHRPHLVETVTEVERFVARRADDIRGAHPAMAHGDVNLLNIIVGDDGSVRFIDWDVPGVRYPLAELSALDEHAYLHGLDGLPPAFFEGYGGDVPADLLMAYRIIGCLGWLASDDWSGWEADAAMPPAARARLNRWHRRLLHWVDQLPDVVRMLM